MNITMTLDDDLVKEVRKIAADRGTTLTGLVRIYLERSDTVDASGKSTVRVGCSGTDKVGSSRP